MLVQSASVIIDLAVKRVHSFVIFCIQDPRRLNAGAISISYCRLGHEMFIVF